MGNTYLDLTREQFKALHAFDAKGPLQMLNLLKFKDHVDETNRSGRDQYKDYMKAVIPFFEKANAVTKFYGAPIFTLIGPDSHLEWDKVLIIEYKNKADFINMITAEGYPAEMRRIALEDSRLIICKS